MEDKDTALATKTDTFLDTPLMSDLRYRAPPTQFAMEKTLPMIASANDMTISKPINKSPEHVTKDIEMISNNERMPNKYKTN